MLFEKEGEALTLSEFEALTGAPFLSYLDLDNPLLQKLTSQGAKLQKKERFSREQLWLGSYFKKEILSHFIPPVAIRWINPVLGWGVFALSDFKKMDFIAEYTGKVRKRRKEDQKNGYCFEYLLTQGIKSPYLIDAREQGGVARYINHSDDPNLIPALATFDHLTHVVLYAKESIPKGTQLTYHYGPDYWAHRAPPV